MNFRANFTSQQGSGWYKDTVMAPTHDELGIIGTTKKKQLQIMKANDNHLTARDILRCQESNK